MNKAFDFLNETTKYVYVTKGFRHFGILILHSIESYSELPKAYQLPKM